MTRARELSEIVTSTGLKVDTDTLVVDSANNRVGIGTSSPASSLHVNGGGGIITFGTHPTFHSEIKHDTSINATTFYNNKDNSGHMFQSNGANLLSISGNGNVGIGTDDGDVTSDGNASRTYVGIIGTANRGRLNIGTTASNGADAGTLAFTNGANVLADIFVDTTAGVQNTGNLNISSTDYIRFTTASTEAMHIDSSGNVGIGQSNPTSPNGATDFIHIGNATNQDTSIVLQDAVETWEIYQNDDLSFLFDTTNVMTLQRLTGNVGIGVTPSAPYKMQVNVATNTVSTGSPANSSIAAISGGTTTVGDGVSLQLNNFSGAKETAWRISAVTTSGNNGDLVFNGYAGGSDYPERMRIDSSGNVGIGVVPSAGSFFKTLEIGATGSGIVGRGGADTHFMSGLIWDGSSTFEYTIGDVAVGKYQITDGIHSWATAPAGTAGTTATPQTNMILDASGNLLIGGTNTAPASNDTVGVAISPLGYISTHRTGVSAEFGRDGDGDIVVLRKDGTPVGSIGAANGNLYLGQGDTTIMFSASSDAVLPKGTDGADRDGFINLGQDINRFKDLYLSGGVIFDENPTIVSTTVGARTIGSKTLDDYEEGTWTTTFDALVNLTGTPVLTEARYTKIGNLVSLSGKITGTTVTSAGTETTIVLDAPFLMETSSAQHVGSSFWAGTVRQSGVAVVNSGSNSDEIAVFLPSHSWTGNGNLDITFTFTYQSA